MKRSKLGQAFSMPFSLDKFKIAGIRVVVQFEYPQGSAARRPVGNCGHGEQ